MKRSALLISALALIGAACGSGDSTPTDAIEAPTSTATTSTIAPPSTTTTSASIDNTENFRFAPASVEIHVGDIVRWTVNSGTHTTTSNTAVWDSTAMATGDVFTFTFGQAGSYPYYCAIHPGMQATITVEG